MNIGTRVKVKAVVKFFYDEDGYRFCESRPEEFEAYVTGAANKPVGKYNKGSRHYNMFGRDDDPPSLTITGTVKVVRVRKRLYGREYDVLPEDVEIVDG